MLGSTNAILSMEEKEIKIVTWADGTDEEIVAMVKAADKGEINLVDHWKVGDERVVHLSAMSATGVGESHAAQDVTFVLMDSDCLGFALVDATSGGKTNPNFIVGVKNSLAEKGYINKKETNQYGWSGSDRRDWCNNVFRRAIPESFRNVFKQFKWKQGKGQNTSGLRETTDYFGLPPEKVVYGTSESYSYSDERALYEKWEWYYTSSNKIKKLGDTGETVGWWMCSPKSGNKTDFCWVNLYGTNSFIGADGLFGISPFGCI